MKTFLDILTSGDKNYFDVSAKEQKSFLDGLGPAKDDFDRSFKQYKSQIFFQSKTKSFLINIASIPAVIGLVICYMAMGLFLRKGSKVDAISRIKESEHCEPDSVINKYEIDRTHWREKGGIRPSDYLFTMYLCFRFIFHPYFVVKNLYKIAKYSGLVYTYNPTAFIVCDEFSFTSSIMTSFCDKHGVKHINVMHGEKLFYIRDSYFRFHECYVWDEHYKQLFIEMCAEPNQFYIELPLSMKFDKRDYQDSEQFADYKYYLANYSEEEIASIVKEMEFARKNEKRVKFRPHPHYSDLDLLRKYVPEEEIEFPNVDILVSLSNCGYVVGLYSTVLVQAYFNNIKVILDDVTYKEKCNKLSEIKYILADKVSERLSNYI